MGFERDIIVRMGEDMVKMRSLHEGRIMCIRLGNALQMAAAMHIPAPAAPGAVESLARGVYELRKAHPHLQWDDSPPHGSVQARSTQWVYTLRHQIVGPRTLKAFKGERPLTGWHCVIDLFDHSTLGNGMRALRFESRVYLHALEALEDAKDNALEHLSLAMGELDNEQ